MLMQACDFLEEVNQLKLLLESRPELSWDKKTQFKEWTVNDVIGHLHMFDVAAGITLDSTDELRKFLKQLADERAKGATLIEYTHGWLGGCQGQELLERWYSCAKNLAERYMTADPSRRVAWGGPDMSVRSCISARQMETWAHGLAIFDLLGVERVESDRIRNIAIIGMNTFGWSFVNRNLPAPEQAPHVRLRAPSGDLWEWNAGCSSDFIDGDAVDFCRVVTQTRSLLDTNLKVTGDVAQDWMSNAQCFAGPAQSPPEPGSRFCRQQ